MLETYISYFKRQPLASIPVFLTLLPIFLIWQRRAYLDKTFLILTIYLVFKFITDFIMFDWASQKKNNVIFYNLSIPPRYILTSLMYFYMFDTKYYKKWVIISLPLFTIFTTWDILSTNPSLSNLHDQQLVLYSTTVESLLMLFWILLYFYNTIRALKIPNLLSYPFFWVCSGLLLYYSSFLFIAPVLHYASKWEEWLEIGFLYYCPNIFECVSIVLVSIGISQFPKVSHAK